jgi:preprotein translocase subunit SecA
VPKTTRAQPGRLSSRFWRLLGASTEKNRSRSMSAVTAAEEFDEDAADLSDEKLRKAAGLLNLDDLAESDDIAQFLAIAREAADRTTGLRPFDVQLLGALRMLAGDVIEMATGEGKTLAGAIAAAGYAIAGRHVHVVTINDYLARRDAEWMGPLLEAMGLTVGWITAESTSEERRAAYDRDVTYASVNEIGFDVLRDQLVTDVADLVSPNPDVALIDEADSVLVDEALVPLVLAGTTHRETPRLEIIKLVGEFAADADYDTDADSRNVHLTDVGARKVEKALGGIDLYSEEHVGTTLTEVNVALHAHVLLHRDVHYIVRDDAVHLINASRGRIAQLQRWPDGLQAAVEAKEGIETTETGEVLDTITVQALINRYATVCGMTGTALAAGEQLRQFYKLGVSPIPPNTPNIREDESDRVYITAAAKNDAIVDHIAEVHETGQPVLVGTRDVAESEELHERLLRRGVPAVVLNAKNDAEEAQVIAEAGKFEAITVSTQMAGRGTDIRLGGSDESDHDRVANSAGCTWSAPAGITPNDWTTSCAGGPDARAIRGRRRSSRVGRTTSSPPTSTATNCPRRPTRTVASSAPKPPACSTMPSASPRAGCWMCTPTPGATTSSSPSSAPSSSTAVTRCCAPQPRARSSPSWRRTGTRNCRRTYRKGASRRSAG